MRISISIVVKIPDCARRPSFLVFMASLEHTVAPTTVDLLVAVLDDLDDFQYRT